MKRKICFLLALIMLLGVMPVNVFAQGEELIEVTFVRRDDTTEIVKFTDANMDEELGLRGTPWKGNAFLSKFYFIGWSNNKNFAKDEKGFLLYSNATVSDLLNSINNFSDKFKNIENVLNDISNEVKNIEEINSKKVLNSITNEVKADKDNLNNLLENFKNDRTNKEEVKEETEKLKEKISNLETIVIGLDKDNEVLKRLMDILKKEFDNIVYQIEFLESFYEDKKITLYPNHASSSIARSIGEASVKINDDVVGTDFVNAKADDVKKLGDKTTVNIRNSDFNNDNIKYEVKNLKSEFEMNKFVQSAIYRNPFGGVFENGANWNHLPLKSGFLMKNKKANYFYGDVTVVDLHVHVDERLELPDEFELSFESYTFVPYSVYSGVKTYEDEDNPGKFKVSPVKPGEAYPYIGVDEPGDQLGYGVRERVKDNNPKTTFKVKSKFIDDNGNEVKVHDFVIRTRLRYGFNPKYEKKIEPITMDQIQSNMKLELTSGTFTVPKEEAFKIAKGEADPIVIKGYINGTVYVPRLGGSPIQGMFEPDDKIKSEDEVLTFKLVEDKPEPQPEPKPEPQPQPEEPKAPDYIPYFLIFGNNEEPKTEEHIAYIYGYEDKTVRAEGNLTRAEAAAMVTRLAKLDLSNKTMPAAYKDLEENAWYLGNINAALKAGMIDDIDGMLRPNEKITRAEFAKMLAAIDKDNDYVSTFPDIKGHKYEKEINKIDGNKRIEGFEDGTFRPDEFLTRAEAATFLNRIFNRLADEVAIEKFRYSIIDFKDLNESDWFYYEIVEAANSHEFIRRDKADKYDRVYERWTKLLNF